MSSRTADCKMPRVDSENQVPGGQIQEASGAATSMPSA